MTGTILKQPTRTLCRICGSADLDPHFCVRDQALDRCVACGFIQVRDEPSSATLAAIYSQAYFDQSKYNDTKALEKEISRRMALLRLRLPEGAQVLEAGCGTGDFVSVAKSRYAIYGTDISEYAIERAKEQNPELADRLVAGRLEDSPMAAVQFDAICLWDVIEHLWDPVPVVQDLMQRLKPGGYLFLSTPAIDAPVARLMGRYWAFMTPPEHLGFFGRRSFEALFRTAVPAEIVTRKRRGKWANMAFIGYKLGRIAPAWFPSWLLAPFRWPGIRRLNAYVPTGDVQYLVVRKGAG